MTQYPKGKEKKRIKVRETRKKMGKTNTTEGKTKL